MDNDEIPQDNTNKLIKLQPLIDYLKEAWIQFGIFETNISIDEQMVPYFGNNSLKQFLKGKPVRYGFKIWMMCSSSGYCYNFDIYTGKKARDIGLQAEKLNLGSEVVLDLLSCVKIPQQLTVFFDNFFTSHQLLTILSKKNIQATGTARIDRLKLGDCKRNLLPKSAERGNSAYCSDGTVNVVQWQDCKPVILASNYDCVTPYTFCKRKLPGQKQKINVKQPKMISSYNKYMGGVDLLDKLIGLYQ